MSQTGSKGGRGDEAAKAARVRADYLGRKLTVREVCRRHGISTHTLYHLVDDGCWQFRRPASRCSRNRRRDTGHLLDRLERLAARRLTALEQVAREETEGAADHERLVKALTGLAALLARIEELKAKSVRASGSDEVTTPEEADERRQMLAQKLVAMLEQASGRRLPEDT
jgi:AcrR family transcriptional regulator